MDADGAADGGSGVASVYVTIFFRRPLVAPEEQTYQANGTDGIITPLTVTYTAGQKPFVKKGGFMFDITNGRWYRLTDVVSDTGTVLSVLVDQARPQTDVVANGANFNVVFMAELWTSSHWKRVSDADHASQPLTQSGSSLGTPRLHADRSAGCAVLTLVMMAAFAQIFTQTGNFVARQKGIGENDQAARILTMVLKSDLANRTMLSVAPFHPNMPVLQHETTQEGYLEYSENNPLDDTDDVLQFTISMPLTSPTTNVPSPPLFGTATFLPKQSWHQAPRTPRAPT